MIVLQLPMRVVGFDHMVASRALRIALNKWPIASQRNKLRVRIVNGPPLSKLVFNHVSFVCSDEVNKEDLPCSCESEDHVFGVAHDMLVHHPAFKKLGSADDRAVLASILKGGSKYRAATSLSAQVNLIKTSLTESCKNLVQGHDLKDFVDTFTNLIRDQLQRLAKIRFTSVQIGKPC